MRNCLYTVDIAIETCDCPFCIGGRFCKQFGVFLSNVPLLTTAEKKMFAKLALGQDASTYFFENINLDHLAENPVNTSYNQNQEETDGIKHI